MEFIDIVSRGFSRAAVCCHTAPHGILNDEHSQLFELFAELFDVKADDAVIDISRKSFSSWSLKSDAVMDR